METFRHGDTINELLVAEKNALRTMYLNEITIQYKKWRTANLEITSNEIADLKKKIQLYAEYRNFLFSKKFREDNTFLKQRKLFETVLSEFIYYIIKDVKIIEVLELYFGRAEVPLGIRFEYEKLDNIKKEKLMSISSQKTRLVMGKNILMKYRLEGKRNYIDVDFMMPILILETALVLDDWFVLSYQNQVRKVKSLFPKCLSFIICEVVNHDFHVDVSSSYIDGIYILQKQTTRMKRKGISIDVIQSFLHKIQTHLYKQREDLMKKIQKGILLD
ncbi:MAG TPA: Bpu10I family restriction endonuclease [Candidatus Cloacimonetes bacterium]|nr:Bpu10I family restriction endonuclease [Candidatus Cloacimonadota bacterium]HEX38274.1 Bpu10I family restriction endonuclease [Candidatus Cloacimonadota bacterium]